MTMASHLSHKHLMKQKRVYLSLSCGDETPLYHVTLVSDMNECDTPDQRLFVSVTGKYQYS